MSWYLDYSDATSSSALKNNKFEMKKVFEELRTLQHCHFSSIFFQYSRKTIGTTILNTVNIIFQFRCGAHGGKILAFSATFKSKNYNLGTTRKRCDGIIRDELWKIKS